MRTTLTLPQQKEQGIPTLQPICLYCRDYR